jgi:hypothetical protein
MYLSTYLHQEVLVWMSLLVSLILRKCMFISVICTPKSTNSSLFFVDKRANVVELTSKNLVETVSVALGTGVAAGAVTAGLVGDGAAPLNMPTNLANEVIGVPKFKLAIVATFSIAVIP